MVAGYCGDTSFEEAQCLMLVDTIKDLIMQPIYGFGKHVSCDDRVNIDRSSDCGRFVTDSIS